MLLLYTTFVQGSLVSLPASMSISLNWNWGSLLGMALSNQLIRGLVASFFYKNDGNISFSRVVRLTNEISGGWFIRSLHANGASLFFFLAYLHIGRGLYYRSQFFYLVWRVGIVIFFLLMGTAFIGYVLPWGQIRFWGATVIIRMVSAIPIIGKAITLGVWGDYSVRDITLNRLFRAHFLFPFVLIALVVVHLFFLHSFTSNNPSKSGRFLSKIKFSPLLGWKDFFGFTLFLGGFVFFSVSFPNSLIDRENFLKANPIVTPVHIKPEWYFLFAYAILRCIPNKLGGVIGIIGSIALLAIPMFSHFLLGLSSRFIRLKKFQFWGFVLAFFLLTWLGGQVAEEPFIFTARVVSIIYFLLGMTF